MDDESEPRIAILGAGPIGLEAALYARYLGYSAEVFEREETLAFSNQSVGESMMNGPFKEHVSSLGVAALAAQDTNWKCPAGLAKLTVAEYAQCYLRPLGESDLIAESLHLGMDVQSVSRGEDDAWRINCWSSAGHDSFFTADVILDISGAGSQSFVVEEPDDPDDPTTDHLSFLNPVADFYILGRKSRDAGEKFHFELGIVQIRDLFAILGERENLDVYATMPPIED